MSKQLEAGKRNFHNIRAYVWSIQKYKFCLSVTLIVVTATLLLGSACPLFEGKITKKWPISA